MTPIDVQPIIAFNYRTLHTSVGPRVFTDVVLLYRGEIYGSRVRNALSTAGLRAEAAAFLVRRRKEENDGA